MSDMRAIELSYGEMTTFSSGGIMSKQTKTALRKQYGYCVICPLVPVLLFDIRRSRMNPLWISKKPRTVEGECLEGRCLKCKPEQDPHRGKRPAITPQPSFQSSRSVQSFASSISSCSMSSMEQGDTASVGPAEQASVEQSSGQASSSRNHSQMERQDRSHGNRMPPRHVRSNPQSRGNSADVGSRISNLGSMNRTPPSRAASETVATGYRARETPTKGRSSNASMRHRSSSRDMEGLSEQSLPCGTLSIDDDPGCAYTKSFDASEPTSQVKALRDLTSLLNDMKATGCADILAECLLSTMEAHLAVEDFQLLCLSTITDEFNDEVFDSTVFVSAKGDLRVLDAMQCFPLSLEIQERGCNALQVLATNEGNRADLIRRGACSYLVKALAGHLGDASMVSSVFTTLRILSTEPDGRNILNSLLLSNNVVAAMQCNISSVLIQRDGCAILSNMAVDAENKKVSAIGQSVISAIVNSMQSHVDDESVIASACFSLKNFTYEESNLRSMSRTDNIFESLERAGKFDSVFISAQQTTEKMYISLAQDESLEEQAHKELKMKVAEQSDDPEIVVVVLESMNVFKWSSRISTACFKILKSLALTSNPHKQKLLESINLEQLRSYAEEFRLVEAIQTEATILINLFEEASAVVEGLMSRETTPCSKTAAV